jgi:hypothetical protein
MLAKIVPPLAYYAFFGTYLVFHFYYEETGIFIMAIAHRLRWEYRSRTPAIR